MTLVASLPNHMAYMIVNKICNSSKGQEKQQIFALMASSRWDWNF